MTRSPRRPAIARDRDLRRIKGAILVPEYPFTPEQRAAIAAHEAAKAAAVEGKLTATIGATT